MNQRISDLVDAMNPAPLEKAEHLRRVREQITALISKMLNACPDEERAAIRALTGGEGIPEALEGIRAATEKRWPGLWATLAQLIEKEATLAREVPGATECGGTS